MGVRLAKAMRFCSRLTRGVGRRGMSLRIRAYAYGVATAVACVVFAFVLMLLKEYDWGRLIGVASALCGALIAALLAPSRRFLFGVALFPITCVIIFMLCLAWSSFDPLPDNGGVIEAARVTGSMLPILAVLTVVGAGLGWLAMSLRRLPYSAQQAVAADRPKTGAG